LPQRFWPLGQSKKSKTEVPRRRNQPRRGGGGKIQARWGDLHSKIWTGPGLTEKAEVQTRHAERQQSSLL